MRNKAFTHTSKYAYFIIMLTYLVSCIIIIYMRAKALLVCLHTTHFDVAPFKCPAKNAVNNVRL